MICYQKQKIVDTMTLDLINQFPKIFFCLKLMKSTFENKKVC